MKYKLMAVDVDGTLLDSKDNLTDETVRVVKQGIERGLVFAISTGRPIQSIIPIIDKLGLDLPFIAHNGALVIMGKSQKVLYERNLEPSDAEKIFTMGDKYGASVVVWVDNKSYANRFDERTRLYEGLSRSKLSLVTDLSELLRNGATKVLWHDEPDSIEQYQKEVGKYLSGNVNYHITKPMFLEFVDRHASKAIALKKLAEHFSIKQDEIIAVGDSLNDISMIEFAGLGVAMANARDVVKEKAGYITLSNDEDGVAHVIKEFILAG